MVREFSGRVALEQIIASWDYLLDNKMITPVLKGVINDLEFCEPGLNPDSFQKLMLYLKSKRELKRLKLAVICTMPKDIVFPILAESDERDLSVKTFSTFDAAAEWVSK